MDAIGAPEPQGTTVEEWIMDWLEPRGDVPLKELEAEYDRWHVGEQPSSLHRHLEALQLQGFVKVFRRSHTHVTVLLTPTGRLWRQGQLLDEAIPEPISDLVRILNIHEPDSPEWKWAATRIELKQSLELEQAVISLREMAERINADSDRFKKVEMTIMRAGVVVSLMAGVLGAVVTRWLDK